MQDSGDVHFLSKDDAKITLIKWFVKRGVAIGP